MRLLVYIVFGVMVSGIGYHLYGAEVDRFAAIADLKIAMEQLEQLQADQIKLTEDIEYYSNPHNLEKLLRANFNYRAPDEKLIIVAPEEEGQ